jgi:murein L,D-transpeptidase YcbB/YkuD
MNKAQVISIVGLLALLIGGYALYRSAGRPKISDYRVRGAIRSELAHGLHHIGPKGVDRVDATVLRLYRRRLYVPLWSRGAVLGPQAADLAEVLLNARVDGLNPSTYEAAAIDSLVRQVGKHPDATSLGRLDVMLTHSFLLYASHLASGQIAPREVDPQWFTKPDRVNLTSLLRHALHTNNVKSLLASLAPQQPGYQRLKEAYARYFAMAARGEWPVVPPGPKLALGSNSPRVAILRARLAAEGDLPAQDTGSTMYDAALQQAVQVFEERHGQTTDGTVDTEDLAQLNVPLATRIRQLELNLERWRWLPPRFEDRYLLVNIPDYMLYAYENNRPVLSMRVVVGKEYTRTPVFASKMTYMVLNPTWNVPVSIVQKEIVPAMQQDPGYLEKNDMKVVTPQGSEVDPGSVDLSELASGRYTIRQEPSGDNALGRIKFMFPNQFDVYLHDTPADHLFSREDRDFSHGCIRIERPLDLASYVLRGSRTWDAAQVSEALSTNETQTVTLPHPISVHILYWTAWVDEHGRTQFRDDVYNLDDRLDKALRLNPRATACRSESNAQGRRILYPEPWSPAYLEERLNVHPVAARSRTSSDLIQRLTVDGLCNGVGRLGG